MFAGLAFMSRQIVNSPGFYANRTERQRGIDEPEKEKSMRGSNWYNHKVRRYFGERNKRKAPGEVFPTLNAKFAPVSQPYDEILGRKRNGYRVRACVFVFVCTRERERERKGETM